MLAVLSDPRVEDFWEPVAKGFASMGISRLPPTPAADVRKIFLHGLTEARMRWIPSNAGRLAEVEALAEAAELRSPFPHGLFFFEESLTAVRLADPNSGRVVSMEMSDLLWTDILSPEGHHGVAVFPLLGEVHMPSGLLVFQYGRRLPPPAEDRQVLFVSILPKLWGYPDGWVLPAAQ